MKTLLSFLRAELALFFVAPAAVLLLILHGLPTVLTGSPTGFALVFAALVALILWASFGVVRHAEAVAHHLGEPVGTLVLTLSVISIEITLIASVMLTEANNPALARDTMFSVIMIVMGGLVGTALLLGGLRHREQTFSHQGANAYLAVLIPLAMLTLVLPDYTRATDTPTLSGPQGWFLAVACVLLYGAFLGIQTRVLPHMFQDTHGDQHGHGHAPRYGLWAETALLLAFLVPVIILAEELGEPLDHLISDLGAPAALGGFIIAMLVLTPEALGGIRAATHNRPQRAVNLLVGSVLATIGLTVPAVLAISALFSDRPVLLGLEPAQAMLLATTLLLSVVTLGTGRSHALQGISHLILFGAYIVLIFD